jgi:hypothetical protein
MDIEFKVMGFVIVIVLLSVAVTRSRKQSRGRQSSWGESMSPVTLSFSMNM